MSKPRSIYESSELMKVSDVKRGKGPNHEFLPFDILKPFQSFIIKDCEMKESSVRNATYAAGKRLGKRFKCLKHSELLIYEIGRLPDLVDKKIFDSSDKMKTLAE